MESDCVGYFRRRRSKKKRRRTDDDDEEDDERDNVDDDDDDDEEGTGRDTDGGDHPADTDGDEDLEDSDGEKEEELGRGARTRAKVWPRASAIQATSNALVQAKIQRKARRARKRDSSPLTSLDEDN